MVAILAENVSITINVKPSGKCVVGYYFCIKAVSIMWKLLLLLAIGIIAGRKLKSQTRFLSLNERVISLLIFFLLFILGLSVGKDPEIMSNLGSLGLNALLLSLCAIGGSIFIGWIIQRYLFRLPSEKEDK